MLSFTNATNTTNNIAHTDEGLVDKVKTYVHHIWDNISERSSRNLTTTGNYSSIENETSSLASIFHKPANMSNARFILSTTLRLLAQGLMIVSSNEKTAIILLKSLQKKG